MNSGAQADDSALHTLEGAQAIKLTWSATQLEASGAQIVHTTLQTVPGDQAMTTLHTVTCDQAERVRHSTSSTKREGKTYGGNSMFTW
jgi:hypothetical protein